MKIIPSELLIQSIHPSKSQMAKGVQITHLPTGCVVSCTSERTESKNREKCFLFLKEKIQNRIATYIVTYQAEEYRIPSVSATIKVVIPEDTEELLPLLQQAVFNKWEEKITGYELAEYSGIQASDFSFTLIQHVRAKYAL